jgi:hypothetical protein
MGPSAIALANTSANLSENGTPCSSSEAGSSDENIENLVDQVNEYDFGDDEEDWDSVVYQGPTINSHSTHKHVATAPGHMDGWYPFGKLEVCKPVIVQINLRG